MRQCASLDCCDLLEIQGAEDFHHVKPAHCYISELTTRSAYEIDVIRYRAGFKHLDHFERRQGIKDHYLAHVFERKPNLFPIRCSSNVGAKWTFLLHPADNLFGGRSYNDCLRREAGANVCIFASGEKIVMPGPLGTSMRDFSR